MLSTDKQPVCHRNLLAAQFAEAGLWEVTVQPCQADLLTTSSFNTVMVATQEPGSGTYGLLTAATLAHTHVQSGHLRADSSTRSSRISATRINVAVLLRHDSFSLPTCPHVNRVRTALVTALRRRVLLPSVMNRCLSSMRYRFAGLGECACSQPGAK
jgi:hypothetical protein